PPPLPGNGGRRYPSSRADTRKADVPQLSPHVRKKRALENGAQITWLSRHLGHSSLKVTTDIYGHWERAERKLQATKMEGAFPVSGDCESHPDLVADGVRRCPSAFAGYLSMGRAGTKAPAGARNHGSEGQVRRLARRWS